MARAQMPKALRQAIALYWHTLRRIVGRHASKTGVIAALVGLRVTVRGAAAAAPALALPMQTCGIMFFGEAWANTLPIIRWAVLAFGALGLVWLIKSFNPESHSGSTASWGVLFLLCVVVGFDWVGFWDQVGTFTGSGGAPQALTCGMGGDAGGGA